MESIWQKIRDTIQEFLIGCIKSNLGNMFSSVNTKVTEIAGDVGQTPAGWNSSIYAMIRSLSETVIIPIAGIIITFVLVYELITMVIEKNNLQNFDTFIFYKWIFKAFVAVTLVTHTFDIIMAVFDVAQNVVNSSAGLINANASIDIAAVLGDIETQLEAMELWDLFWLCVQTMLIGLTMHALSICILLVLYGRMMEIFIYVSIAPIPLSTLANREWGGIGQNYLKGLAALGFQGFFIMVCVAIYAVLVQSISNSSDISMTIWSCAGYTVLLCFALFKTGGVSKSIFNAH